MHITSVPNHKTFMNLSWSLSLDYEDKNSDCDSQTCKKKKGYMTASISQRHSKMIRSSWTLAEDVLPIASYWDITELKKSKRA